MPYFMKPTPYPASPLRIRYMSDLHLEMTGYAPNVVADAQEDLVVLAGDIGTGTDGIHWAKRTFPDNPVLYVLGNHEFYGYDWEQLIGEAYSACDGSNVRLLENGVFRYRGVRFLGTSLWTNYLLAGHDRRPQAIETCERIINDFRFIHSGGRNLLARETVERHEQSAAWLRQELEGSDEVTVVITHHAPCLPARHPKFPMDDISNTFFSDLPEEFFRTPAAWIFGHTHYSMEAVEHVGTRLYSNQRGYPRERVDFDWSKVLEVAPGRPETAITPKAAPGADEDCRNGT